MSTVLERPAATVTDAEVQALLATGLRNRWYPVLPSRFVEAGGKPLGLTRLGEKIVVWRDANGVHVAPAGTMVSAITVDAVLVALEPSADLTAWLSTADTPNTPRR